MSESSTSQYNHTMSMGNITDTDSKVVYNETMSMANITIAVSGWKWDFIAISTYQIIIWFFGSIGNLFSLAFFSRKGFRSTLTGFLFQCLAVFDFIVVQEHIKGIFNLAGITVFAYSTWVCCVYIWTVVSARVMAVWILVAIVVERGIAVWFPYMLKIICSLKRGKRLVCIFIIGVMILEIPQILATETFIRFDIGLDRNISYCFINFTTDIGHYMFYIEPWIAFSPYSAVPFCIIFITNIVIIVGVRRAQNKRKSMTSSQRGETTSSDSRVNQMMIMLILVSVSFIVLTAPWCIYILLRNFAGIYVPEYGNTAYLLLALNHSINFWLYCLSGKRFRQDFVNMISCRDT